MNYPCKRCGIPDNINFQHTCKIATNSGIGLHSEKDVNELCGYMILTPTPEHNGGMTCAERLPCKYHTRGFTFDKKHNDEMIKGLDKAMNQTHEEFLKDEMMKFGEFPPTATRHGEEGYLIDSKTAELWNDSVGPSNWEKEFDEIIGEVPENAIYKYLDRETCVMCGHPTLNDIAVKELKDFIRTQIQLESDKAYRRGQRDAQNLKTSGNINC